MQGGHLLLFSLQSFSLFHHLYTFLVQIIPALSSKYQFVFFLCVCINDFCLLRHGRSRLITHKFVCEMVYERTCTTISLHSFQTVWDIWDHSTFFPTTVSMCLTWDERHTHTFEACKVCLVLLHSCWEDGRMINYSTFLSSYAPFPLSCSSVFRNAGEVSAGYLHSLFCNGVSRPPQGLLVWTLWIRICNDTEQRT